MRSYKNVSTLVLGLPLLLSGAEWQNEAAVNTGVGLSSRWQLTVYTRGRMVTGARQWNDVSIVPRLQYRFRPRMNILLGHFHTWALGRDEAWHETDRPYAGVEFGLWRTRQWTLSHRTLWERFFVHGGPDWNRYRTQLQLYGQLRPYHPYASVEAFFDQHGSRTTRYRSGLRIDVGRHHGIEFGYWYERRKVAEPGLRHMLVVSVHLYFPGLAPDS